MNSLPTLSLLLAAPLAGAVLAAVAGDGRAARRIAALTLGLTLLIAIGMLAQFDPTVAGFQLVEKHEWIPALGIHYHLGIDGISVLFPALTVLLFAGVLVDEWHSRAPMPCLFQSLLLAQLALTLGIFCALDGILFFLFWELSLLPLYFLISLRGTGPERQHAAAQYVLIMLASGTLLLFGLLLAASPASSGAAWNFNLPELFAQPPAPDRQWLIFLLLLAGFAAKTPLIPLHTWLPTTAMQGPVAIVALLVGLKLGAFGIIRIAVPLAPIAARDLHWLLAGLGTVGVLYGAVAALTQTNLRRMLACSSISHVGLVLLGIASFDALGIQGSIMLLAGFTLTAGGLMILTAFLHRRTGSTDVFDLGGIADSAPRLTGGFLVLGLASIGLPGLAAFPAELAIIVSALGTHTGAGLAALFGGVVGAAAMLASSRRAFFGPVGKCGPLPDLLPRELAYLFVVLGLVLAAGLAPGLVFDLIRVSAEAWAAGGTSP
jgi:NADH-quinone oxidoreductase subunit M